MAQTMTVLGLEIATLVLHVVGMDDAGQVVLRKRIARRELWAFIATGPPLRIGMEACGSAHDWARCVRAHGHEVRVIAPPCLTASGKSPKHEARDAAAIGDAVTRPPRRVGPMKRSEPPDLQALHRVRERRMNARTAWVHESRGRRSEDGMVLPPSLAKCRAWIIEQREADQAQRTALSTAVFWHLDEEFLALEKRRAYDDETRTARGQAPPDCHRRQTIPGLGPVTATARIAAIGDVTPCNHGRQRAAWPGLVPREPSTGGQPRLLGISTRGERSRRQLLVPGAPATLRWGDTRSDERRRGLRARLARRGKTRAAVALAKNNARMVWALLAYHHE